jgi:hypothetical protein
MGYEIDMELLYKVIGGLFGLFIVHYLTKRRERTKYFREASRRFRETFSEEIVRLQSGNEDAHKVLKNMFPKYQQAKIDFEYYLSNKQKNELKQAWNDFCCQRVSEIEVPFWEQYFDGGSLSKRQELNKIALERIEKLLSYAKD